MRFEVPEVPFNESGWGPCTLPAHLKDVPYAPYGKNDRIGRVADWTSSGRDHHGHGGKYDKRREREKQEAAAAGASVFGGAAFQTEEEDSFSLVDSRPTYKPRYGRRPQRFISRREREKEREEQIKLQGGPAAQAAKLQRPKRKENWNYYRRDFNRFKYAASVDIRPEWTVLEQIQLSSLNKLSYKVGEATTLKQCGRLAFYDKAYERVTPKNERAPAMGLFGLVFVGKSFPVDASQVAQISQTNWVLDVTQSVTPAFTDLKEICLFLSSPASLDQSCALGLYVSCAGGDWQYRGCVTVCRPSDVFPTAWPTGESREEERKKNAIHSYQGECSACTESSYRRTAEDRLRFMTTTLTTTTCHLNSSSSLRCLRQERTPSRGAPA